MAKIWLWSVAVSCLVSFATGSTAEVAESILYAGDNALRLMLTLLASMTLWSGLMEIMRESGDVERIGRGFRRLAGPLFPGLQDPAAWSAMSMNVAANLMGLGNAATPAGMEAAGRLAQLGEPGMRALAMLLVINNSSIQLLPANVMALRQAAGSADASAIWVPALLVSAVSTLTGVLLMRMLQRGGEAYAGRRRYAHRRIDGPDSHPGHDGRV